MPPTRKRLTVTVTSWNHLGEESRRAYRQGYLKAVILLVDHLEKEALATDFWSKASVIYPIMYLYRHHIEISIKDIVALARSFTWVGAANPKRLGHSLVDLWKEFLGYVEMLQGKEAACQIDALHGAVIGKLHAIDPSGDRFRYPVNLSGEAQFQMNMEVDILDIKENASRFHDSISELDHDFRALIDPDDPDAAARVYLYLGPAGELPCAKCCSPTS